ncbi:ComEC/Rec2 family competence protein [Nitrosovibrio sp. Nv6]|uniref:ComEC/Rec2 family competence protein n=1 Tax=Nitrosovibrio sp. Nv6 TaxID=1855340 RepID=UPI0008ADEFFF|nr:ComEC/Rec2 family competence protein [Nitrosovibrio sp. Nv6]SEP26829.1 competence protein ComEC [Nitrosovibrio sp. Nv6]
MQAYILAFAVGVGLLQQQAALPAIALAYALLPGAALAFLFLRARDATFIAIGKALLTGVFLGAGFFWAAAFAQWRLADVLPHEWEGRDIQLIGVVAELPQVNERHVRFAFDVEQVLTTGAIVPAHISLSWYDEHGKRSAAEAAPPKISAGERWRITTRLKRPHGSVNPHGFDFEQWALERNIRASGYVRKNDGNMRLDEMVSRPAYQIERLREEVRESFTRALPGHAYTGVLVALAVGDQRAIPREQWQIFTRTGINHLMSISGLHVTMVSGLIFALVYWLWRRSHYLTLLLPARKAAAVAGLVVALGYALLAGFAIPAQRTVYMLAVVAIALWLGRSTSMTAVLAWALLAVVMFDPWAVLSPGFWLSFGAIAVIMLISVGRIGRSHWLIGWARVQWAITLSLIPPLLAMFQQVSLVSPVANAIAIPLVSLVVVPLTLLAALPPLDFMLTPAHWLLSACMEAMQWMSDSPQAVWSQHAPPTWAVMAGMAGIFWIMLPGALGLGLGSGGLGPRLTTGFPARWLGLVALLPMFLALPPKPASGELWLTILDVGQGLAVVARTENYALLYDTGPGFSSEADSGNRTIVPFLRAEGIKHLDAMIVTHADGDHSGGALSVQQAVPVEWLVSSLSDDHPIQRAASNRQRCRAGQSWQWDGIRFDMLHPSEHNYSNPRLKTNALSCVLKITTLHGSVLLPGDIEKKSEYQLLANDAGNLASTVLVAPHHGSKTSSTDEFVRRVNPGLVIFTVGYRNRFGHPKDDVVERYRAVGSRLLRSDIDGAILLRFEDNDLSVETSRALRRRYWQDIPEINTRA